MKRRGLTLMELVVVLVILVALATLIVPSISFFGRGSQKVSTRENLLRLQELLVNRYLADMGELPRPNLTLFPGRPDHPQLRYLFVNPDTETPLRGADQTWLSTRRWQGPYVTHSGAKYALDATRNFTEAYGLGDAAGPPLVPGDPTVLDAWGRPIVIQVPVTGGGSPPSADDLTYARLVSAGANGVINTPETMQMPATSDRGDDVVLFLFRNDDYGDGVPRLEQ